MATPTALVPAAPPTRQSTPDVFRNGRFEPNDRSIIADDAGIPSDGKAFVPYARALAWLAAEPAANSAIGVVLGPGDDVSALVPVLDRVDAIAIDFPKFTDGRGFSQAVRLARGGFKGELRAIGDVLIDQIAFMTRVGISAFEVRHAVTRRYLRDGRNPKPMLHLQPSVRAETAAGARPWARRTP